MKKKVAISPKPSKKRNTLRTEFYHAVADLLRNARTNSYRAVNFAMVEAYWNVGRMIVEEEQKGQKRAGYGKALIQALSDQLTSDLGPGVWRD